MAVENRSRGRLGDFGVGLAVAFVAALLAFEAAKSPYGEPGNPAAVPAELEQAGAVEKYLRDFPPPRYRETSDYQAMLRYIHAQSPLVTPLVARDGSTATARLGVDAGDSFCAGAFHLITKWRAAPFASVRVHPCAARQGNGADASDLTR